VRTNSITDAPASCTDKQEKAKQAARMLRRKFHLPVFPGLY
jgi:hypothetical protein